MLWPNAQKHGSMDDPGVTLYTDPFTKCGCELVRLRVAQTDKKKILKSRFSGKDGLAKSRCSSSESSRQHTHRTAAALISLVAAASVHCPCDNTHVGTAATGNLVRKVFGLRCPALLATTACHRNCSPLSSSMVVQNGFDSVYGELCDINL